MDVSHILAEHTAKGSVNTFPSYSEHHTDLHFCSKATAVDKEIPLEVDTGFLTVTDLNPIDAESYEYVCFIVFSFLQSHDVFFTELTLKTISCPPPEMAHKPS